MGASDCIDAVTLQVKTADVETVTMEEGRPKVVQQSMRLVIDEDHREVQETQADQWGGEET
jgi:hypothetical protein